MKIRYYQFLSTLKEKRLSLEGLRRKLNLLPTEIAKIETNRLISMPTLMRICSHLDLDVNNVTEVYQGEDELFFNARILRSHSYVPKKHIKKEFIKDTDAQ